MTTQNEPFVPTAYLGVLHHSVSPGSAQAFVKTRFDKRKWRVVTVNEDEIKAS
jgi:hypothetical protein